VARSHRQILAVSRDSGTGAAWLQAGGRGYATSICGRV